MSKKGTLIYIVLCPIAIGIEERGDNWDRAIGQMSAHQEDKDFLDYPDGSFCVHHSQPLPCSFCESYKKMKGMITYDVETPDNNWHMGAQFKHSVDGMKERIVVETNLSRNLGDMSQRQPSGEDMYFWITNDLKLGVTRHPDDSRIAFVGVKSNYNILAYPVRLNLDALDKMEAFIHFVRRKTKSRRVTSKINLSALPKSPKYSAKVKEYYDILVRADNDIENGGKKVHVS